MKLRAITGFFFIIVMLGSVLLGPYVFDIFYLVLSVFCLWEFYTNVKKSGTNPNWITGLTSGVLIYSVYAIATHFGSPFHNQLQILLPVILSTIFIQELFKKHEKPFTNVAYTYLGMFFTVVPFTFFHALGYINKGVSFGWHTVIDYSFNFHFPLAFLLMLWANDTGAYLVGSKFGKHKLFERHSPKKTWEGFIGGVVITAGAAFLISNYYTDISATHWIIMGVLISCFGTIGDLIESMFKRSINIKDSGGILPGHGGLLDRFDGLFIAAPIVYAYLHFVTNS